MFNSGLFLEMTGDNCDNRYGKNHNDCNNAGHKKHPILKFSDYSQYTVTLEREVLYLCKKEYLQHFEGILFFILTLQCFFLLLPLLIE